MSGRPVRTTREVADAIGRDIPHTLERLRQLEQAGLAETCPGGGWRMTEQAEKRYGRTFQARDS